MKKYQSYLSRIFISNFLVVSLVFFCIGFLINIFEEMKFFEKYDVEIYYPIYLSLLNIPSLLLEIFPFIFLVSTKFFFIYLNDKSEIEILKSNGVSYIKMLSIISALSLLIGLVIVLFYYSFSSKLKSNYLDVKNKFSNKNEYLAVVNDSGLWIKEEMGENLNIIHAEKFMKNSLKNITISQLDKKYNSNYTYRASSADITKNIWILKDVKILNNTKGSKEDFKKLMYQSTFNGDIISNLFSNLNSLNIFQLLKLSDNYSKIGYSTTEVKVHLNKLYSMPIFFILMTVLGFLIMIKFKFLKSKFFTVVFGIFVSVIVYYINYFSSLFGTNATMPVIVSIWTPHLILFLVCTLGVVRINEN